MKNQQGKKITKRQFKSSYLETATRSVCGVASGDKSPGSQIHITRQRRRTGFPAPEALGLVNREFLCSSAANAPKLPTQEGLGWQQREKEAGQTSPCARGVWPQALLLYLRETQYMFLPNDADPGYHSGSYPEKPRTKYTVSLPFLLNMCFHCFQKKTTEVQSESVSPSSQPGSVFTPRVSSLLRVYLPFSSQPH